MRLEVGKPGVRVKVQVKIEVEAWATMQHTPKSDKNLTLRLPGWFLFFSTSIHHFLFLSLLHPWWKKATCIDGSPPHRLIWHFNHLNVSADSESRLYAREDPQTSCRAGEKPRNILIKVLRT